MYCSKCNKTLPEGTSFCDTCGSQLVSNPNPAPYQPNNNYQAFTPPPYPMSAQATANNQVSTGKWIGVFLINIIPIVGPLIYIIMLFVWAFGDCKYPSLKSFAKAMLILALIGIIIAIVVMLFFYPMVAELIENGLPFEFEY